MKNKIYIGLIVFILLPAVFATCPFESLSAGASGSDLETMSSEVQGEYDSSVQAAAENIANQLRGKTPVTSAPEITVTPEMRDAIAAKLAARGSEPIVTAPTIEVTPEMQAAIAAKMDAQRATVIDTVASTGDEPATLPDAEGFVNNGRRLRSRTATPQSSCPPGQRCLENLDRGDGTAPSQPTAGNLLGNPPIAGESSQEMPASVAGTTPTDATTTPDTPATPTETIEISPGVLLLPQTDGTFEVDAPRHPGWSGVIVSMDQEENAIVFVRSSVSDEDWNEAEDSGFTQQIESAVRASVEERSLENLPDDVWDTDYLPIQEREDTAPITSPPSAPATPAEPIELAEGFYLMSESDGVFEIGFGGTATSNLRAVIEDGEINMFTVDANGERTEWNPESGIRANIDAALRTAIAEQAETTSQTQMVASSRIEAEATSETITTPVGEPESIPLNYGDLVLTPGQGNDYSIMFSGESGNEDTAVRVRRNEYGEVVYTDAEGNALSIDDVSNLDSQVIEAIQNNLPNADGETPAAPAADETPDTTEGEEAPESDETTEDDEEPEDETPAEDEDETGIPSSTTLGNGVTITVRPDGTSSITAPNGVLIASGNLNDDGTISYTDAAGNPISDEEIQQTLAVTPQQLEEMDEAVSRGPNFATRQRMDALELWSGAANKYGGWVGLFMKPGEAAGLAGNIARWAGYDADSMSEGQAATLLWFQNAFGYDAWAGKMCRTQLISEEGTTFVSASGHTSIDISGEREIIDPCAGHGDWKLTHNNTAADCTKYYQYRITGEAVPAEVYMEFDVYLNDADTGIEYNIGKDDHLYWDEMEGEGLLVKLNRSGERWSLAGMNMVVYETEADFDKVCLRFTERSFENMQTVIQALRNKDNPFCNKIIDAEPRQDGKEKEAARRSVSIGGSTSTTVGGGIGGSSSARGIVSGGGE